MTDSTAGETSGDPSATAGTSGPERAPLAAGHGMPADESAGTASTVTAAVPGLLPAPRVVALIAFVAIVFWLARPILAPFVIAAVVAYAFTPVVQAVEDRTVLRRGAAVALFFVVALAVIGVLGLAIGERLGTELQLLATSGPDALATLLRQVLGADSLTIAGTTLSVGDLAREVQGSLASSLGTPGGAIHVASRVAEVALQAILALIVTFYLLLDGVRLRDAALRFLPPAGRRRAMVLGGRIHVVLGRWMRGQVLLIALVAGVTYVILGPILHVPYALALGILTGVLEIIPLVGPLIAAALAGVVAFSAGGSGLAVSVLVIYFVIRQVEDQVVMPLVIGRAVHLHPVVTIFAVLLGISVWGVLGGLLAVPVAAAVNVTLRELYPETTVPAPEG